MNKLLLFFDGRKVCGVAVIRNNEEDDGGGSVVIAGR